MKIGWKKTKERKVNEYFITRNDVMERRNGRAKRLNKGHEKRKILASIHSYFAYSFFHRQFVCDTSYKEKKKQKEAKEDERIERIMYTIRKKEGNKT